jgi:hypothetical protein
MFVFSAFPSNRSHGRGSLRILGDGDTHFEVMAIIVPVGNACGR